MKTIQSLGKDRQVLREWDKDPACYHGWKTKPVWLKSINHAGKKIHLAGLGDVGQNIALGLVLQGEGLVEHVGLYDLNEAQCLRLEGELSQIAPPPGQAGLPSVKVLKEEQLFDCDLFLFCATKSIPAVGSGVKDVRMAQYGANRPLLAYYACMAAEKNYRGLFAVVSDPVDLLCMEALRSSRDMQGKGRPLTTDQIVGCGLGVMYARALYYARQSEEYASFLKEGRAFGPHGEGLVIANSTVPGHYQEELSQELTRRTVQANMQIRRLGFKPFLAPAMSSAVLTLLSAIRGEWCCCASYLNGLYYGALTRQTPEGIEWEEGELPDQLYTRLESSYRHLEGILWD